MQGIYTYISETNHVPREYSVAAILLLLFMVPIYLVPALVLLHLYVSNFRSYCCCCCCCCCCRSQWPRGINRGPEVTRLLGLWVRILQQVRLKTCEIIIRVL